ncbi:Autophagy-related protein 11 [Phaffia rhodozyma]|uniref:Autophagy-related protein 11 n=1 Tax=Phaffia rhodozyma TaxID=264483 RepID=A0A0F7SK89_PHARH|nr:Autophagy-related protein 11 [Phaffia rhodozyma]
MSVIVFRAHDGFQTTLPQAHFESIYELCQAAGDALEVHPDSVILFFANGDQIREENVLTVGREDTSEIHLFSREILQQDPSITIPTLHLHLPLPPSTPPATLFQTYLIPIHDSLLAQSFALNLATSNLAHHLDSLERAYRSFAPVARRELDRQADLLAGYEGSLWLAGKIKVGARVVEAAAKNSSRGGERYLRDYVSEKKMGIVRDGCVRLNAELSSRFDQVDAEIEGLLADSAELRSIVDGLSLAEAEECIGVADRVVKRVKKIEQDEECADNSDSRELEDLDLLIRQKIELHLEIKNSFTAQMVHSLLRISSLQSTIAMLPDRLTALENDLRNRQGFAHLGRLEAMPGAYGRLLIECVRRREFAKFFLSTSQLLAELMAKLVSSERKRRERYREEVHGMLPWDPKGLDVAPPALELTTAGGESDDAFLGIERSDVDEFLTYLRSLETDPEYMDLRFRAKTDSTTNEEPCPLASTISELEKHQAKIDDVVLEFEKLAETSLRHRQKTSKSKGMVDSTIHQELVLRMQSLEAEVTTKQSAIDELQANYSIAQTELTILQDKADYETNQIDVLSNALAALQADHKGLQEKFTELRLEGERRTSDSNRERGIHLRELAQARMKIQDMEETLSGAREQLKKQTQDIETIRTEKEKEVKEKVGEAERVLRDHVTEADGDRAILEHQVSQLQAQLDELKQTSETSLRSVKDRFTRDVDTIRAELKFEKVQSKTFERKAQQLSSEVQTLQASSLEKEQELRLTVEEALKVATALKGADERLVDVLRSSSMGASLALPPLVPIVSPLTNIEASKVEKTVTGKEKEGQYQESLGRLKAYDVEAFEDLMLKTMKLVKKWQLKCSEHRDRAKDKIAIGNFTINDLALFLPTRNFSAAIRPWAAFNVNFPHYFLSTTSALAEFLLTREYYLARITQISEQTVDSQSATSPTSVGLPIGTTYFVLETSEFSPTPIRTRSRRITSHSSTTATPSEGKSRRTISPAVSPTLHRLTSRPLRDPMAGETAVPEDYFGQGVSSTMASLDSSLLPQTFKRDSSPEASSSSPNTSGISIPSLSRVPSAGIAGDSTDTDVSTRTTTATVITGMPVANPKTNSSIPIPIPASRSPHFHPPKGRAPSVSSSSSSKRGSFKSMAGRPPSVSSKALATIGTTTIGHPTTGQPDESSFAAATLSKPPSSTDLASRLRGEDISGGQSLAGTSPGRMSLLSSAVAGLGLSKRSPRASFSVGGEARPTRLARELGMDEGDSQE